MRCDVVYSPLARDDLDEIWDYIALEQGVPAAAQAVVTAIVDRISQLSSFPLLGTPLAEDGLAERQYRYVLAKGYLAFYRRADRVIYVDRILHSRRDYMRALLGEVAEE